MNGASISRGCSHGLISYFPLIVRVHLPANVNKMLTEKKDRRREGKFEAWEKTKAQPVRAGQIGDLQSSVLTAPLIRLLQIILYRCKVINAKGAVHRFGRDLYGSSIAHIVQWLYPLSGGNCYPLRDKAVALCSRLISIDRTVTIVLVYSFAADCVIGEWEAIGTNEFHEFVCHLIS